MLGQVIRSALLSATLLAALPATAAPPRSTSSERELVQGRGETDRAFAARALKLPEDEVQTTTATWNGIRTIFADFVTGADSETPERPLVAFQRTQEGGHRRILVTIGETEGGEPEIAALGFANADRDPAKELIVLLAWRQMHDGACGPIYEVRILDDLESAGASLRILPISKRFGAGCAQPPGSFRFTTIGAVKRELARLGH